MAHRSMQDVDQAASQRTGVVVPVYFPPDFPRAEGRALLTDTVLQYTRRLTRPAQLCLSVDGCPLAAEIAAELAAATGVQLTVAEQNRGKLQAVRNGMLRLLAQSDLQWLAAVDQDGDHFANELVNLVRAGLHVRQAVHTPHVLVLGRRISRHRPMGYVRGELEELADRVLLDALHYDAAATGRPLPMQFATTLEEVPDFHSGYKLFSRETAAATFTPEPDSCGLPETCAWRHACEAVMTVEPLQHGAVLACVNRSTFDEQPITTFGLLNRQQLVADKMIWPCKRLSVPGTFVAQWLANHLPRIQLATLAPDGRAELLAIAGIVLAAFNLPPIGEITRPRFI